MSRIFKGNMRIFTETIKLTDKKKLHNVTDVTEFPNANHTPNVNSAIKILRNKNCYHPQQLLNSEVKE